MPARARSYGAWLWMGWPSQVMLPLLDGHQAHEAFEQRGFADAVAAEQDGDFAGGGGEAHVTQDVGAAVVLVDVLDGEHGFFRCFWPIALIW
jgi:hypothetical protein